MGMNTKEHSLLVEKYRSKNLNEYVGNDHIKKQIKEDSVSKSESKNARIC